MPRNVEIGVAPLAVIQSRLDYATYAGNRLHGLKLNFGKDEKEEYTKRDLPLLNLLSFEEEETHWEAGQGNVLAVTGTVTFGLNIHHRNPILDYKVEQERNSAVYYLNRIRDVIETDYDGSEDPQLEDTCRTGISTQVIESKIDGGAPHHIFEIEVTYQGHPFFRGTRTDTVSLRDIGVSA